MRFGLAVLMLVAVVARPSAAFAAEPIRAAIVTLPVEDDPTNCFPQRFVATTVVGDRVEVEALKLHPDRRLWLANDLVVFGTGGKFGYCDRQGVIRIPAIYEDAQTFHESRAVIRENDKYGYIDTDGKVIVKPTLEWAYGFHKGLGCVQSGELWGIVDRDGAWIKRPVYARLDPLVGGIMAETVDGKEGWVDSTGNISQYR